MNQQQKSEKSFVKKVLSSDSEWSSKRLFGAIGFIICLGLLIYEAVVEGNQLSSGYEITIITSASLLGVESIVNAFGNRNR